MSETCGQVPEQSGDLLGAWPFRCALREAGSRGAGAEKAAAAGLHELDELDELDLHKLSYDFLDKPQYLGVRLGFSASFRFSISRIHWVTLRY